MTSGRDVIRAVAWRDLFPWLGERKLKDVEPVELLATLRKVEERGAVETADRGLMLCRQIWRYGVATGRVDRDIAADPSEKIVLFVPSDLGGAADIVARAAKPRE